jgi:hypothetical protein
MFVCGGDSMRAARLGTAFVLVLLSGSGHAATSRVPPRYADAARIQSLVDNLRARLTLSHPVAVSLVPANALLVSVEAADDEGRGFKLSLEDRFVRGLDADELSAVVAHELGHVWIFTHHPYLQTERLANEIAMRIVPRDTLRRVYAKVWERLGTKGDLGRFLGD